MTLVYMFPGQSSRYPGMLEKLVELHPPNRQVLERASALLGRDLAAHFRASGEEVFARNRDIQVGVFLANHMFLQILNTAGLRADLSLGLSLGEYNHLVHIEALTFEQALVTVERRGEAYDQGPSGAMASVFPISHDELLEVVARVRQPGVLEVANLNSPRQQVLAGETALMEEALQVLEEETYAQAVIIERRIPMHSSLFTAVGQSFRGHLETLAFSPPRLPYVPNRRAHIIEQPDRDAFVELLATHVHQPVLWRQSIDYVVERWPDAIFVEVGPRSALYNLLDRKWHRNRKFRLDRRDDTRAHLEAVLKELAESVRKLPCR